MATLHGIDFLRDGKQAGHIAIPHSAHRSAYGQIVLPLVWIRNGPGPVALLTAGVHGDEFEGQIALRNLARTLPPAAVIYIAIVLIITRIFRFLERRLSRHLPQR